MKTSANVWHVSWADASLAFMAFMAFIAFMASCASPLLECGDLWSTRSIMNSYIFRHLHYFHHKPFPCLTTTVNQLGPILEASAILDKTKEHLNLSETTPLWNVIGTFCKARSENIYWCNSLWPCGWFSDPFSMVEWPAGHFELPYHIETFRT